MNEVVETTIIFNSKATDGDMAILDAHPEIKTIGFRASAISRLGSGSGGYFDLQITDAGFAHIAKARNLETLIFDPRRPLKISDNALQPLVGLKIKNLHLAATKFTAQGLAVLSKLQALTDFSADASAAGDVCAAAGKFPHLRVLTLAPYQWDGGALGVTDTRRSYPSDEDIEQLAALSELEELYLDDSPLTDAMVPTLLKFTKLRVLHVQKSQLTDAGLAQLSKLSKLEELNLNGTAITDRAMDTIAGFSALKVLFLDRTEVTDEGLAKLNNLPQLVSLSARWCQIDLHPPIGFGGREGHSSIHLEPISSRRPSQRVSRTHQPQENARQLHYIRRQSHAHCRVRDGKIPKWRRGIYPDIAFAKTRCVLESAVPIGLADLESHQALVVQRENATLLGGQQTGHPKELCKNKS